MDLKETFTFEINKVDKGNTLQYLDKLRKSTKSLDNSYKKLKSTLKSSGADVAKVATKSSTSALRKYSATIREATQAVKQYGAGWERLATVASARTKITEASQKAQAQYGRIIKTTTNAIEKVSDETEKYKLEQVKQLAIQKQTTVASKERSALLKLERARVRSLNQINKEANERLKAYKRTADIAKVATKSSTSALRKYNATVRDATKYVKSYEVGVKQLASISTAETKIRKASQKAQSQYERIIRVTSNAIKKTTDATKRYKLEQAKQLAIQKQSAVLSQERSALLTLERARVSSLNQIDKDASIGLMQYNAVVREQTKLIQLAKHPFMRMIAARKAMKQATLEATLQDKHYSDAIRKTEKEMLASTSVTMREALATKRNTLEKYKNNLALKHTKELINFNNISIKAYTQSIYRATMALRRFGIFMSRYVSTTMTAATGIGIKMAANIEAQTVRFGILTQSMARGKKLFEDIISFSAKTPFQLGDLDKAAQTLLAFGSPLTDVMDELRRLGDIAQGDSEKLERIVNSFGKVRSRGTAHMRELNRFIMSGVPIIQQLNENIGVTGEQLFKMVETNQITFDDVKKAIVDLTNKEGRFYKMTEKVSKTLEGRFSTALDNFKLDLASLGELWTDNIKQILENFIDWSQGFRMLSDSAKRSIGIAIASLAAIGPVAKAASLAVKGLGASFMALRAILIGGELTNPFTAILAVVQMIGVVFAGFQVKKAYDNMKGAAELAEKVVAYTKDIEQANTYVQLSYKGISEELYDLAKAYDAPAKAAEHFAQAELLEAELRAGYKKTAEDKKYKLSLDVNTELAKEAFGDLGTALAEATIEAGNDVEVGFALFKSKVQDTIDTMIITSPDEARTEAFIKSVLGTTDISKLTQEQFEALPFDELIAKFDSESTNYWDKLEAIWRQKLNKQIEDLKSGKVFKQEYGLDEKSIKETFNKLIAGVPEVVAGTMSDLYEGTITITTAFSRLERENEKINDTLSDYIEELEDSATGLAIISQASQKAENATKALDVATQYLIKDHLEMIRTSAGMENALDALFGLDTDSVNAMENELKIIKGILMKEVTDIGYSLEDIEAFTVGDMVIPQELQPYVDRAQELVRLIANATREEAEKVTGDVSILETYLGDPAKFIEDYTRKLDLQGIADKIAELAQSINMEWTIADMLAHKGEMSDKDIALLNRYLRNLKSKMEEEAKTLPTGDVSVVESFLGDPTKFVEDYLKKLELQRLADKLAELAQEVSPKWTIADMFVNQTELTPEQRKKLKALLKEFGIVSKTKEVISIGDAMTNIWSGLGDVLQDSVLPAFEQIGASLAEGATGLEAFENGVKSIKDAIVDSLPQLLFEAGISMLAGPNWEVGLALLAASGLASIYKGATSSDETIPTITESTSSIDYSRATPLTTSADTRTIVDSPVYINVTNNSSAQVETVESRAIDGSRQIEFLIHDTVKKGIVEGAFDDQMTATYGVTRRGRRG